MADRRTVGRGRVSQLILGASLSIGLTLAAPAPAAHASLAGGVGNIFKGVLAPVMGALSGTFSGPPIIGTVAGAAMGLVQGVGMTANGAFQIVGAAFPMAAAAAPYLPFFL